MLMPMTAGQLEMVNSVASTPKASRVYPTPVIQMLSNDGVLNVKSSMRPLIRVRVEIAKRQTPNVDLN